MQRVMDWFDRVVFRVHSFEHKHDKKYVPPVRIVYGMNLDVANKTVYAKKGTEWCKLCELRE